MLGYKEIYKNLKLNYSATLCIFLSFILFIGYLLPVLLYRIPTGTDVYTHIFYTEQLRDSDSLSAFYQTCNEKGYTLCDYPFGLWLFGSITSKVTGMSVYDISYILPLILLFFTCGLYFAYSRLFLKSNDEALIAVAFLLSMPIISISLLAYTTLIFAIPLLLLVLYFTFDEHIHLIKRIALIMPVLFVLSITHTGTYMFLFFFAFSYLVLSAVLWGKLDYDVYALTASVLLVYTVSMGYFPYVQSQYIDKTTLVITVGEWISSKTGIGLFGELSNVFYQRVFLDNGVVDSILWSALIYMVCEIIAIIRSRLSVPDSLKKNLQIGIPALGDVSHSVITTPFWIGPIQTVLSLFGFITISDQGKCILLSVFVVSVLPGALHTDSTGALREIEYFLIILPITASAGLTFLINKAGFMLKNNLTRAVYYFGLFLIFLTLVVTPFIGNAYYRPSITGEEFERQGLNWLGGIGSLDEGVEGAGYREMITVYSGKLVPSATTVQSGSDMRQLERYISDVYANSNSEYSADDLYAQFKVKYLLVSDRVLRNMELETSNLTIDSNTKLDKLYSGTGNFAVYSYIEPTYAPITNLKSNINLYFDEDYPVMRDAGTEYFIESKNYKTLLNKQSPEIRYIGGAGINLGEGEIDDKLTIYWRGGPKDGQYDVLYLSDLNYSINVFGNEVDYSTFLRGSEENDTRATLEVRYTFYQNAIKREIEVHNDWLGSSDMEVGFYTNIFSPLSHFKFYEGDGEPTNRIVYPVQDNVQLSGKFDSMFISDGSTGIYFRYVDTAPHPDTVFYRGSLLYNLSSVLFGGKYTAADSKSVHVTQLLSFGTEDAAKKNIKGYTSASIYPYPEGKPPLVIVSYIDSLNASIEPTLNLSLQAYDEYKKLNVSNFTEGVRMRNGDINLTAMNMISKYGTDVILYENVYRNEFDDAATQADKIGTAIANSMIYTSYYKVAPSEVNLNDTSKEELLSLIDEYNTSRANEFDCKRSIGIDRFPCFDLDSCWQACYTPVCQQVKVGAGAPFLEAVWALANSSSSIDSDISAFEEKLLSITELKNLQQIDDLTIIIDNIENESSSIGSNPIFDMQTLGFCYPNRYNLMALESIKAELAAKRDRVYPLFNANSVSNETFNVLTDGIILEGLRYNLDTIKIMQSNNISLAVVDSVGRLYDSTYDEGLRHPEFAYYKGNNTRIVLLPVSGPTTAYLELIGTLYDYVAAWESTIGSVIKNDDLCVFLWSSNEIGMGNYSKGIASVVGYANESRMRFSNPEEIAKHYVLLNRISANVSMHTDTAKVTVRNYNPEEVKGVAFKLDMPIIEGACPYAANGAAIARIVEDSSCKVYVSTDLDADSESNLTVGPNMKKNSFKIQLEGYPTEGNVVIVVKDSLDRPVRDAFLNLGTAAKKTDGNGTATFYLSRGNYTVSVEKPGFLGLTDIIEVKGKVYLLERISVYFYVIIAFVLAVVYYELRKRHHK